MTMFADKSTIKQARSYIGMPKVQGTGIIAAFFFFMFQE